MSDSGNDSSTSRLEQITLGDQRWKMVRSAIEHEDNLINQRLSWLFVGHTLLFTCFAVVQYTVLAKEVALRPAVTIELGLAVVMLCAAIVALITNRNNTLANIHTNSLRQWWIDHYNPDECHYEDRRSVITRFIQFITCTQRAEDFSPVQSRMTGEVASTEVENQHVKEQEGPAVSYPPILGQVPNRRGSIPALMAVTDVALLVVCLGVSSEKFLDSLQVATPRIIASPSSSAGSGLADQGQEINNDVNSSLQDTTQGNSDAGGSRSVEAIDIP